MCVKKTSPFVKRRAALAIHLTCDREVTGSQQGLGVGRAREVGRSIGDPVMCMRSFVTTARLTLAAATLAALAGSATAADLGARAPAPYYPPPPPPPLFSWTGCYIGGNIGSGWGSHSSHYFTGAGTAVARADLGSHTASGFIGGGQIGCDYQAGVWVFGVQGMFDGSGMQGSN